MVGSSPFDLPRDRAFLVPSFLALYALITFGAVPYLTRTKGIVESHLAPSLHTAFRLVGLGEPTRNRWPVALLAAAFGVTFVLTAVASVTANAAGSPQGLKNKEPRVARRNLVGTPGRVVAAHDALMEAFAPFVGAVLLVHSLDAAHSLSLANELSLAFVSKFVLFPLFYYVDFDAGRSGSHLFFIGSVAQVLLKLGFQGWASK